MFQKIPVPLDGSEHSFKALDEAAQIAQKFSGNITLLHTYFLQPLLMLGPSAASSPTIPSLTGADLSKMAEATQQLGNKILEDGEQRIKATNVQVKKMLVEGHVVEEIVRVANQGNFDLIVIGARGISHMREMLLGSITDGVIHHVHCPVLVIK